MGEYTIFFSPSCETRRHYCLAPSHRLVSAEEASESSPQLPSATIIEARGRDEVAQGSTLRGPSTAPLCREQENMRYSVPQPPGQSKATSLSRVRFEPATLQKLLASRKDSPLVGITLRAVLELLGPRLRLREGSPFLTQSLHPPTSAPHASREARWAALCEIPPQHPSFFRGGSHFFFGPQSRNASMLGI